jgi:hypothetical protein
MADERPAHQRPFRNDRPQFGGGPRPPFRPGPRPEPPPAQTPHAFRLRDGDREIEVSGSAPFVRQLLDDLPSLLAKLRGEPAVSPRAIRMPSPPEATALEVVGSPLETPEAPQRNGSIEDRVLAILRESRRPLAVAAIRKRLGTDVTPQQVRRVLERAGKRVTASGQRPATYRLSDR